jgi:tetratricopeptide (TPR) repeat protein
MTEEHEWNLSQSPDRWLGWLVVVVTGLVFLPWLTGALVWDDPLLISENLVTDRLSNLALFFQVDLWDTTPKPVGPTGFYRPLMLLDLCIDHILFDNSPRALRIHSLIWHLAVVTLFVRLALRLGLSHIAAAAGGVLVGLHPVQAEVVFFVSARNDSMAAAWLLGALLWLLPPAGDPSRRRLWAAGACTLAAALCKESVLLAPFALVLLSMWRGAPWSRSGVGAMCGGLVAYLLLRQASGVSWPEGAGLSRTFEVAPAALSFYARDILLPLDIGPGLHLAWPPQIPSWALWLAGGIGALVWRFGDRRLALCAGLLCVFGAPALVAAGATNTPAQRYLYLSMVALGLGLAVVMERLSIALQRGLSAVLLVGLAGLVGQNALQWQSDTMLWSEAVERHGGGYAMGAYAKTLEDEGRLEEAGSWYAQATQIQPPFVESCYNVAQVQIRLGRPWLALENGLAALDSGCPAEEELLSPVGLALALGGNWSAAEEILAGTTRDPWGQIVLVKLAAAVVRGELEPLRSESGTLDPSHPLVRQVRFVLRQGGASSALQSLDEAAQSERASSSSVP